MSDEDYRKIFQKKLNYYMALNNKSQTDLMNDLNLISSTISSWCTGTKLPRMGKIQMLADYFNINKSDLLEDKDSSETKYYTNNETANMAQKIFENKELRLLFDTAQDADPEDLETVHNMLLALKRKERGSYDT